MKNMPKLLCISIAVQSFDFFIKNYPPELATHYGCYIGEIRKFCRE